LNGTPAPPRYRSDDERRDAVRRVRAEQVADEVRADAGRAAQEDSIAARARQRREDALTRTRLSPKPRPSSFGAHVRAMCQHESAHAVAGWATGNPATGITLDYRATTHGWRIRGGETQFISDTSAIVRLAGIAADVLAEGRLAAVMRRDASGRPRLTPEFRAELESSGARGDWRYTRGLVSRGSGFDGENDPDVAFARAVDVVREHWNAIEAATDALVTAPAGRLDGREIQDAIDSARGLWLRQRR
jgi:hypothetical protein